MLVNGGGVGTDTGRRAHFKVHSFLLGKLIVTHVINHVIPMTNPLCSQFLYSLVEDKVNVYLCDLCICTNIRPPPHTHTHHTHTHTHPHTHTHIYLLHISSWSGFSCMHSHMQSQFPRCLEPLHMPLVQCQQLIPSHVHTDHAPRPILLCQTYNFHAAFCMYGNAQQDSEYDTTLVKCDLQTVNMIHL